MTKIIKCIYKNYIFEKNCTNFYTKIKLYLVPDTYMIFVNKNREFLFLMLMFSAASIPIM